MDIDTFTDTVKWGLYNTVPSARTHNLTPAATLVPIMDTPEGVALGLMKRPDSETIHGGQICFPGGHIEPGEEPLGAALRETEEEVGIDRKLVEVIGFMRPVKTMATRFIVWPVVGVITQEPKIILKPDEAEDFFWAPVSFLNNHKNIGRRYETLPGEKEPRPAFHYNGYEVWGLTFRIIEILFSSFHPAD